MKRKVLAVALAAVMALSLAACGGSDSGSSSDSSSTTTTAAAATEAAAADSGDAEAAADVETQATDWAPSTTVSIVVPASAGGNTDLSARVFAQYAKELTGADYIVVNSNGASGSVAANQVLSSAPDGHTFLYGHALVNVANIAGITDYNYEAFTLGPTFAKDPAQGFYVNSEMYEDLEDFIAAAKAAPGQLKACTEVGAYTYYELLEFEKVCDIDLDLIDVGSNSDKITAMLSGQCDLMPGSYINTKDYVEAGQFRCIGVPLEERSPIIPDFPTMKEQGYDMVYPDCDFSFYFPADTPDDVIVFYENLVQEMIADPTAAEAIRNVEMEPYYLSAADSAANEAWMYETIKEIADSVQ